MSVFFPDAFPSDLAAARATFVRESTRAGAVLESHNLMGAASTSDGELGTDAAWFGPDAPARLLVVTSGVHGTELFAGSGCQTLLAASDLLARRRMDTGVLLIHAINPWGAAHGRRNNEENVDLCRNFIDFDGALPRNEAYEALREALQPPPLEMLSPERARAVLSELRERWGPRATMNGLMAGQYTDPQGFSFGGAKPTWSRRVLLDLIGRRAGHATQICIIDLHTGLGPWAHGTVVCLHRGVAMQRARRWFGDEVFAPRELPPDAPEGLFDVTGHCTDGYVSAFGAERVTSIVLEFGTYAVERVFPALIEDHWLQAVGMPAGPQRERIQREMLELHYPSDPRWRRAIWERSLQVTNQALAGLEATA